MPSAASSSTPAACLDTPFDVPARTPRQIHFVTGKGGVGKSLVACALARCFVAESDRTLLVQVNARDSHAPLLGIAPVGDDLVVTHRTYSGFFGTDLDAQLRAKGVDTLVLTGCLTEIHLFATAVDALQRGYNVEVPEALQAGSSALAEQVALKTLSVMAPVQPLA